MGKNTYNIVVFNCQKSFIRVILSVVKDNKISYEVIHQIDNYETEFVGKSYWNIIYIFEELKIGLKKAYEKCGYIDSVGVCTWGRDYGLISNSDQLLSSPLCLKNKYGEAAFNKIDDVERKRLFDLSGLQCSEVNTLYQIVGYRDKYPNIFNLADSILLIPDLIIYLFTGEMGTEASITGTTQYYDFNKRSYSSEILERFNISESKFPKIIKNGEVRGYIREEIVLRLGINKFPFICVASHNIASAIASVPLEEDFIFINSDKYPLIGTEIEEPIINSHLYKKGFSNHVGVFDKVNLLKDIPEINVVQKLKYSAKTLDSSLFKYFYEYIGECYKQYISEIEKITNKQYKNVYIVGSGSKNNILNQVIANKTERNVIAGLYDATSFGSIGIQLSYFIDDFNLNNIRSIIKNSVDIKVYNPKC